MIKEIFVNLPVKNLNTSVKFFTKLGFTFDPQFTDENATCMIISQNIFAMLLTEKFFKTFIGKEICDTKKSVEAIVALSLKNKTAVDETVQKAISAGGVEHEKLQDYGWMYQRSFRDLDGHLWNIFWMDKAKMPKQA